MVEFVASISGCQGFRNSSLAQRQQAKVALGNISTGGVLKRRRNSTVTAWTTTSSFDCSHDSCATILCSDPVRQSCSQSMDIVRDIGDMEVGSSSPGPAGRNDTTSDGSCPSDLSQETVGGSKRKHNGLAPEALQALDEKRLRRVLSNRESAARSKDRRQKHVKELLTTINTLNQEFATLQSKNATSREENEVIANNANMLHQQMQELQRHVSHLNSENQLLLGHLRSLQSSLGIREPAPAYALPVSARHPFGTLAGVVKQEQDGEGSTMHVLPAVSRVLKLPSGNFCTAPISPPLHTAGSSSQSASPSLVNLSLAWINSSPSSLPGSQSPIRPTSPRSLFSHGHIAKPANVPVPAMAVLSEVQLGTQLRTRSSSPFSLATGTSSAALPVQLREPNCSPIPEEINAISRASVLSNRQEPLHHLQSLEVALRGTGSPFRPRPVSTSFVSGSASASQPACVPNASELLARSFDQEEGGTPFTTQLMNLDRVQDPSSTGPP